MDEKISVVVVLVFIYLNHHTGIYAKTYYDAVPKPLVCQAFDAELIHNITCITKPFNQTTVFRTIDIYFQPGVVIKTFHMEIQLFRKLGANYKPFIFKTDQDMCMFINGINSREATILKHFIDIDTIRKSGNYYDPCPLTGRRYMMDVKNDYSKLPDVVQRGDYRLNASSYTIIDDVKRYLFLLQTNVEVRTKLKKKTKK